jgi:hypothetical protein
MPPRAEQPLLVWERWLYGGLGSLAPIFVAILAIDLETVFRNADFPVVASWSLRTVVLFLIGGFVAFLHKKETDSWRCFVIGISAPALITTAISGKQVSRISRLVVSSATAGELPLPAIQEIKVLPLMELAETSASKFERGFLGRDPLRSYIVIATESDGRNATELAKSVYRYSQCALKDPRNKGSLAASSELRDLSPPLVVVSDRENAFAVVALFSDPGAANGYVAMMRRNPESFNLSLDTVTTSRSNARTDFRAYVFGFLSDFISGKNTAEETRDVSKWSYIADKQCLSVGVNPRDLFIKSPPLP